MNAQVTSFAQLSLRQELLRALDEVGYETPSPIQAGTIPLLLAGSDLLGQAQTGTGKTAAFALPILSRLRLEDRHVQALVLAPTRELAIQVAEAFQTYAKHLPGFHVLPVYGGSDYGAQIRSLKRGTHVVVGTPGRIMDHIRKGTLQLDKLDTLVLDEGDEMLRMGFIDDVEWIMQQMPEQHQTALFSATMPAPIRRIVDRYLNQPKEITVKVSTTTAETIRQRYLVVRGGQKLEALTRILEAETGEGMIIFVRTKTATLELSEKLSARGYSCAPLNGDISQQMREQTVARLKSGALDIVIATDVAARGLDVERISHVLNYDIPYDTEAYVHRIGRTGRAGRAGEAILFVVPRERRMLQAIEKATRKKIEPMSLPSSEEINRMRVLRFREQIDAALAQEGIERFETLIDDYRRENSVDDRRLAAALARLALGDEPFLQESLEDEPAEAGFGNDRGERRKQDRSERSDRKESRGRKGQSATKSKSLGPLEEGMVRYRLAVGHEHHVKPGNIVGAIANEAGLDSKYIGRIEIFDDYTVIDLPAGMPKDIFKQLKRTWVSGQRLDITPYQAQAPQGRSSKAKASAKPRKPRKEKNES